MLVVWAVPALGLRKLVGASPVVNHNAEEPCYSDAGQKCMSKCELDAATGSTGKFDYMFEEGGDPCFLHDGEGMCVYAEDDTILIGKCDPDAAGCNAGGACDRQDLTGTGSGY